MKDYEVSFWSGRGGDVQITQTAATAKDALAIAVAGGGNATIATPDGESYTIDEFRDAIEALGDNA